MRKTVFNFFAHVKNMTDYPCTSVLNQSPNLIQKDQVNEVPYNESTEYKKLTR